MIRALTILATVVALAVSATPASAGTSNTKVPPSGVESFAIDIGTAESAKSLHVANHTEGTVSVVRDRKTAPEILSADHNI